MPTNGASGAAAWTSRAREATPAGPPSTLGLKRMTPPRRRSRSARAKVGGSAVPGKPPMTSCPQVATRVMLIVPLSHVSHEPAPPGRDPPRPGGRRRVMLTMKDARGAARMDRLVELVHVGNRVRAEGGVRAAVAH